LDNEFVIHDIKVIEGNKGKKSTVIKESVEQSVYRDEELIAKGINKNEVKEEVQESPETIEGYKEKIQGLMNSIDPAKKKSLLPKVKKAKLPIDFNSINDLDTLKQFYQVITE
jgi:DNA-binding cell septation regulator SpoVG